MSKFFITGGAGFLGYNLVKKLAKNNHFVSIYDNFSRSHEKVLSGMSSKINLLEGDVKDFNNLKKKSEGNDIFIHMAAINGTEFFYENPQDVLDVSLRGTLNAIDVCKENNIKSFIYASSSEVYQEPNMFPTPETIELKIPDIFNPRYSYGGGKLVSELICSNYYKEFFEKMIIFRPHNVYGPKMGWEHVIPQIIVKIKESKKKNKKVLEIKGDGSQTRSFIYIDDFVEALTKVILDGEHRNIYHIGNNDEVSIMDLTKLIINLMNLNFDISTSSKPKGETNRRCPDDSKIRKLGYEKKFKLIDGLKKTIKWYLENERDKK